MEERNKTFTEPVILVSIPFKMMREVAQETVLRTHELVVRLTTGSPDAPSLPAAKPW